MADWGGGISVVLHRGSNCPLSRAMDGRIMRRGIISSCQSAATSEIVKRCCSSICKQRYSKYSDLYLYLYLYGYLPRYFSSLDELRDDCDEQLFSSARYNPYHVFHRLLPESKNMNYNLRSTETHTRSHFAYGC